MPCAASAGYAPWPKHARSRRLERQALAAAAAAAAAAATGRLDANGGQISGFCGHTFHLHIVYLRALLVRNRRLFFRICFVASCEMAVAGRTGPNAARIMPKVHDMWVNSLAALLPPISV